MKGLQRLNSCYMRSFADHCFIACDMQMSNCCKVPGLCIVIFFFGNFITKLLVSARDEDYISEALNYQRNKLGKHFVSLLMPYHFLDCSKCFIIPSITVSASVSSYSFTEKFCPLSAPWIMQDKCFPVAGRKMQYIGFSRAAARPSS